MAAKNKFKKGQTFTEEYVDKLGFKHTAFKKFKKSYIDPRDFGTPIEKNKSWNSR